MNLLKQLQQKLQGEPDNVLTIILLVIAAFTVMVAIGGTPLSKAAVATWLILP